MKLLSMLTVICLCLVLVVGLAQAEREVTITKLTQEVRTLDASKSAAADCAMGNLNSPAYAIGDWIWGAESYKYMFYADEAQCAACSEGFTVEAVNMYLQFGAEDVPASFTAFVDFEEAAWDEVLGCWVPGPEVCTSPAYTVTITDPGLYNISLPMDAESCPCAYFGYWYGVSFSFLDAFPEASRPDLITDDTVVGCTSWNDYGSGWIDFVDFGMPGEASIYADIVCCANPVSIELKSFGDVKALFR